MKGWIGLLTIFGFILSACAPDLKGPVEDTLQVLTPVNLPTLMDAPELTSDVWLNSEVPLRLTNLRGKVVLLEMWTFG